MSSAGQGFSNDVILGRDQNIVSVDFGHDGISNEEWRQAIHKEGDMSANISKTELEALLKANKSEVDVVAANIQKEMSEWREHQNEQMSKVVTVLSTLDVKLDERYENQKLSTTNTQWLVGIAIAVAALVPAFIGIFKADTPQQPTVIYVQQPTQQQIAEQPKQHPSN